MRTAREALAALVARGNPRAASVLQRFFKTGPGEYGEGDVFLGLCVPDVRALVQQGDAIAESEIVKLLQRPEHEARMMALLLLVRRFQRGTPADRRRIYRLYLQQRRWINNWDLVDCSAEHVVGAYLADRSRAPLDVLARSRRLWDRRIAVLATFHFIKRGDGSTTLRLADRLLDDPEDLMHKAIGWMLREVGKRDQAALESFLKPRLPRIPRTMLRYAIERFPEPLRQLYLSGEVGGAVARRPGASVCQCNDANGGSPGGFALPRVGRLGQAGRTGPRAAGPPGVGNASGTGVAPVRRPRPPAAAEASAAGRRSTRAPGKRRDA